MSVMLSPCQLNALVTGLHVEGAVGQIEAGEPWALIPRKSTDAASASPATWLLNRVQGHPLSAGSAQLIVVAVYHFSLR